jgi:urea carboxylase system permease
MTVTEPGTGRRFGLRPRSGPTEAYDAAADHADLATLGYKQGLDRSLGSFSSFAAGFSYISIMTGMFQLFYFGFSSGGPAYFWTWPTVFLGQLMVCLCFAELAAHYPIAGAVYQWSKQVGTKLVSWLAGWFMLVASIVSVAAVALAWQIILPQVSGVFQIIGTDTETTSADGAKNAVLLGAILILFSTLINAFGVKLMSRINNIGVAAELVGVTLLIVLLAVHAKRGPGVVLQTHGTGDGYPAGYLGAFLVAALASAYVLYGFDTAGSLAEETNNPRKYAPSSLIKALCASGLAGLLVILFAEMAVGNISADEISVSGLPFIVKDTLGNTLGDVFLLDSALAITVCVLAVHTAAIRIMFSMGRDNNLPFGRALARISRQSSAPVVPSVIVGVLAIAILLINVGQSQVFLVLTSVAIILVYIAYLLVTAPLLLRRLRGWPRVGGSSAAKTQKLFALGRWGVPVNLVAVGWGIFMIINLAWPRNAVYNASPPLHTYYQWFAVWFPAAVGLLGGAYYLLVQRHRTGVLEEHRASVAPSVTPASPPTTTDTAGSPR